MLTALQEGNTKRQAWVAAEASAVAAVRRALLDQEVVEHDNLHAVAYWKAGRASEDRERRIVTRFMAAMNGGLAITDPHIRARIEHAADVT